MILLIGWYYVKLENKNRSVELYLVHLDKVS